MRIRKSIEKNLENSCYASFDSLTQQSFSDPELTVMELKNILKLVKDGSLVMNAEKDVRNPKGHCYLLESLYNYIEHEINNGNLPVKNPLIVSEILPNAIVKEVIRQMHIIYPERKLVRMSRSTRSSSTRSSSTRSSSSRSPPTRSLSSRSPPTRSHLQEDYQQDHLTPSRLWEINRQFRRNMNSELAHYYTNRGIPRITFDTPDQREAERILQLMIMNDEEYDYYYSEVAESEEPVPVEVGPNLRTEDIISISVDQERECLKLADKINYLLLVYKLYSNGGNWPSEAEDYPQNPRNLLRLINSYRESIRFILTGHEESPLASSVLAGSFSFGNNFSLKPKQKRVNKSPKSHQKRVNKSKS